MGGDPNQKLTTMVDSDHRDLHNDLNNFLVGKTKIVNGNTVHMRPQSGNSGAEIAQNFTRRERLDALADFYRGSGAKYGNAANDFFAQHPGFAEISLKQLIIKYNQLWQ